METQRVQLRRTISRLGKPSRNLEIGTQVRDSENAQSNLDCAEQVYWLKFYVHASILYSIANTRNKH